MVVVVVNGDDDYDDDNDDGDDGDDNDDRAPDLLGGRWHPSPPAKVVE